MWIRRPLLALKKRLLIYLTIIVPTMLHNCDSWGPKTTLNDRAGQMSQMPSSIHSWHTLAKHHRQQSALLELHAIHSFSSLSQYKHPDGECQNMYHTFPQDTPAQLALHSVAERLQSTRDDMGIVKQTFSILSKLI